MYKCSGEPKWGVPKNKDMNLSLAKLTLKDTFKGLGTGANEWVDWFMRHLSWHSHSGSVDPQPC
jgi:hypothetical protein